MEIFILFELYIYKHYIVVYDIVLDPLKQYRCIKNFIGLVSVKLHNEKLIDWKLRKLDWCSINYIEVLEIVCIHCKLDQWINCMEFFNLILKSLNWIYIYIIIDKVQVNWQLIFKLEFICKRKAESIYLQMYK